MKAIRFILSVVVVSTLNTILVVHYLGHPGVSAGPVATMNGDVNGDGGINIADPVYLLDWLFAAGPLPVAIAGPPGLTADQAEILSHMSIEYLTDEIGGSYKTIRFTGVNVQVVNGLGATNGLPSTPYIFGYDFFEANGVGNLILGYNEPRASTTGHTDDRSGSHNVVVGRENDYSGYGGVVFGEDGCIGGGFNSVLGGQGNEVRPFNAGHCTMVGGQGNEIEGYNNVIVGGNGNDMISHPTFLSDNAVQCVIVGGANNTVDASIGGTAVQAATIVGGQSNSAIGQALGGVISGGAFRAVSGENDWVAGSLFEDQ